MRRLGTFLVLLTAAATMAAEARAGDIEAGRKLTRQHCTRCHVVAGLNTMGIGSTPSFKYMVNNLKNYEEKFLAFYTLRPHPAFITIRGIPPLTDIPPSIAPIELTPEDVEDIAAFARTFKEE